MWRKRIKVNANNQRYSEADALKWSTIYRIFNRTSKKTRYKEVFAAHRYLGEKIEDCLGDGKNLGVEIEIDYGRPELDTAKD